ncbi:MAG: hypothetical protein JST92_06375 [Deltaproteobacteria bacterium]|nr:hypothetical protein [Deltaproteobacteria bacterium]
MSFGTKPTLLTAALLAATSIACGADLTDANDSDTDDLSDTTYSMEMVRANPALLPSVQVVDARKVTGHGRPGAQADVAHTNFQGGGWDAAWLYDANGLGQFKNLADPAVHKDDKATATYARKPGDLFAADGKLVWTNVAQGGLGDCYFAASLASTLLADKGGDLTKNMIVPVIEKGKVVSYKVTFFQASGRKVAIEVDPDLPHSVATGDVFYMSSTDNAPGYEEWAPSLIEKAYAKWHRSYNAIGNGGTAADALYALGGKTTKQYAAKSATVVAAIDKAAKANKAQVACTYGEKDGVKYDGTGVYADHCYTLRGIEKKDGKTFVMLRNPWGPWHDTEPSGPGSDGVQDGLFSLELSVFQTLYLDVSIVP